ncbi:MAG TPA: bifunctional hydroxymethylpyrimidine kinase/phosphomethylpyrimidine kinase [Stellaceae bacterium]|nr:bifunctional hydroxymethylpyrimidine kinase/phosphomethylpyrimidine kinase [Stellaceae bacterium]
MKGRVLIVAGSDSSGGAGIQADIKTVTALGGYAATAVTALTAQSTLGISGIVPVAPAFVRQQMEAVLGDIGADCIKTGMLHDAGIIAAVADCLAAAAPDVPRVVDPVMVSTSGARLLDEAAIGVLKERLIAGAAVLTPNIPEAEALLGRPIAGAEAMAEAAAVLRKLGAATVVLTGGHLGGATVRDVVVEGDARYVLESPRIETRHTHGTGCTLASAIAAGLAQGLSTRAAIERARDFVQRAIRSAPGYGKGHGPVDHAHTVGVSRPCSDP